MNLNSYSDIRAVVEEYVEARAEALMLEVPNDKWSTRRCVEASLISDFVFVLANPDPKDALEYQIRVWQESVAKDRARVYEAGEIAAAALPEEVVS